MPSTLRRNISTDPRVQFHEFLKEMSFNNVIYAKEIL